MKVAVVTYAYNEAVNLPIWAKYYSRNFGSENLFVFDHGSSDESTSNLGPVNVLRVPHTPFEDVSKSISLSLLHRMLLQHYDCAIVTDCDELIVPEPTKYTNLLDYLDRVRPSVMGCVGLHLHHILNQELALDLTKPVLSQRRFANFSAPCTKPLISSVPVSWAAGCHAISIKPQIDPELYLFHTKYMDYTVATQRHMMNSTNTWSEAQEASGHGAHHRYALQQFVHEGFLVPMDIVTQGYLSSFEFKSEAAGMTEGITERDGFYFVGEVNSKFVEIPERIRSSF